MSKSWLNQLQSLLGDTKGIDILPALKDGDSYSIQTGA